MLIIFFKCGIKCENHSVAVILIKRLFELNELYEIFSEFKKDRIDNQYYLPIIDSEPVTKEKCNEKLLTAKRFNFILRVYMMNLTHNQIDIIRNKFELY